MTQFLRDQASDREEVVTPLMLDGTYLSRNYATLGPMIRQPPCESFDDKSPINGCLDLNDLESSKKHSYFYGLFLFFVYLFDPQLMINACGWIKFVSSLKDSDWSTWIFPKNRCYNQMNMKIIVFVSTGIHPSLNLYSIICEPSSCNVETLTMERFLLSSISILCLSVTSQE